MGVNPHPRQGLRSSIPTAPLYSRAARRIQPHAPSRTPRSMLGTPRESCRELTQGTAGRFTIRGRRGLGWREGLFPPPPPHTHTPSLFYLRMRAWVRKQPVLASREKQTLQGFQGAG
ncbi:hypothetical protein KIL84_021373 [Mauremys mutica]|uniref:Uncharacterized protein n=1 Tax=Mauremys mutica TaxID=74926 RepID=A0A9D4AYX7_9SAUR|nr:hypothetical protein KIL84_021373 [Mauremys mutica]